ncbi:hypothetical protein DPMN_173259 [Dreissena polymorpha]|uniref:Uncharacterized protein n=1 Tax=Dreissena polymorpha TaxID=45954 RepID=A0A9D4E4R5_DREPO|nr:hypothetical protein DPMN_173259 [Dreissena polymorpha]
MTGCERLKPEKRLLARYDKVRGEFPSRNIHVSSSHVVEGEFVERSERSSWS